LSQAEEVDMPKDQREAQDQLQRSLQIASVVVQDLRQLLDTEGTAELI
tara:strand:+ start:64735 stop:64878 length:144 start_codon:yes stop_codon:yes gene_type:complete